MGAISQALFLCASVARQSIDAWQEGLHALRPQDLVRLAVDVNVRTRPNRLVGLSKLRAAGVRCHEAASGQ